MALATTTNWTMNLERSGGRDGLKDPLGYKQDINEVVVRQAVKNNVTQQEVLENVSSKLGRVIYVFCFLFRKRGLLRSHLWGSCLCSCSSSG